LTVDDVRACSATELVVAAATCGAICSRPAVELVCLCVASNVVFAAAAAGKVVTVAASKDVCSSASSQLVATRSSGEGVVAAEPAYDIVSVGADEDVIAVGPNDCAGRLVHDLHGEGAGRAGALIVTYLVGECVGPCGHDSDI
jgi:hypothetical protein